VRANHRAPPRRQERQGSEGQPSAGRSAGLFVGRRADRAAARARRDGGVGAAIEVHRHLGPGYLEGAYEQALAIELRLRGIDLERQAPIPLTYKGYEIGEGRVDFLVRKELVVELKAVESALPVHKTQVISYLKALGLHLGLLINFNVRVLKAGIQRVIRS
jgi:GxxExxY protein